MLRVDIQQIQEVKAETGKNVQITLSLINDVIQTYTKMNYESWDKSGFPKFIASRMADRECNTIRALRTFVSSKVFDEKTQLDQAELFKLATDLFNTLHTSDTILDQAIDPLITLLGKNRIKAANILKNRDPDRSVLLFEVLCKIPDENARYVAAIYWFEGENFELTSENIELITKHSDRLKTLFDHAKSMYQSVCSLNSSTDDFSEIMDLSNLMAFLMFFVQQLQSNEEAWMNKLMNQLVTATINHKDHLLEVIYGLAWITNHGINIEENVNLIDQRPEDLNWLPQVGLTAIEDEKTNRDFNQKLFDFAIAEGAKRREYKGKLFNQNSVEDESKEHLENNIILPIFKK